MEVNGNTDPVFGFISKQKKLQYILTKWHKDFVQNILNKLESLYKQLEVIQANHISTESYKIEQQITGEMEKIEALEESFWRDKARELFVKCGDKNTSYFQAKANSRYKLNKISCLKKRMESGFMRGMI